MEGFTLGALCLGIFWVYCVFNIRELRMVLREVVSLALGMR